MKILLIEDNVRLAERITHHLRKQFVVEVAQNGRDGKNKALSRAYSIILLDLHLPDVYGLEICKQLRAEGLLMPILVISGDREVESKVNLLNTGADDYIVKPFDSAELTARIHALLRRYPKEYNQNVISVKDLVIDINGRKVQRGGVPIELRRKEFDILEYLVMNKGRAVTRSMIIDNVWNDAKDSWHNTVDVHVKYLRDKVDRPFDTALIKTAYGVGYMVDDSS